MGQRGGGVSGGGGQKLSSGRRGWEERSGMGGNIPAVI